MNTKKGILILAAALLLCSVQLFLAIPASASDNVTDEHEVLLQAPPPPPPSEPPPGPPPPTPPYPPMPPSPDWHFPGYNPYTGHWDYHWPYGWRWPWYVSGRVVVVQPYYQPPYQPVVYAPVINSFTANPSYIQAGQGIVLTWTTTNATSVTLSPGIGSVPNSGSYNLSPGYTTTYTLSATNSAGSISASTTVTVAPYVSTYTTSSTQIASTANDPTVAGSILTGGFSSLSDNPVLLITLLGLLAVAAALAVVFLVRRPAAAHAGGNRRNGYLATATRASGRTPATTPVDSGPRLIMSNGEGIPLSSGGSLGRSDFSPLVKADEADLISRRHIRFDFEDGDCFIEDRGSTNGTRINGSPINGKGRYLLREGDKVELADVLTLTFKS
jgi:hypothetical protein